MSAEYDKAAAATLQEKLDGRPFTVAEFRARIALIMGVTPSAVAGVKSVPDCLLRRKGDAPTPSEVMMEKKRKERKRRGR